VREREEENAALGFQVAETERGRVTVTDLYLIT
jgi:hypothetical protein